MEGIADRLARRHDIPAHIACVSRLVCDFHRTEDDAAVVPSESDGHLIPGNIGADVEARLNLFHRPYHYELGKLIERVKPRMIIALHSFTPSLATSDEQRPWEVGLLYNQDDRAARFAIDLFSEMGFTVGDNEPYSGKQLNATMDRHAEANGIPYLTIELRQDHVARKSHQAVWADRIALVADKVSAMLASR